MKKTAIITIRAEPGDKSLLAELARSRKTSMSEAVRVLIRKEAGQIKQTEVTAND